MRIKQIFLTFLFLFSFGLPISLFSADNVSIIVRHTKESPRLFYGNSDFSDFVLSGQFRTHNGSKAILLFHTNDSLLKGYAVAIDNDQKSNVWWRKSGSLMFVRNIVKSYAKDDEWFDMKIKVHGAEIDVWINDVHVVEYIEPQIPYRTKELENMKLSCGKIAVALVKGDWVETKDIKIEKLPPRCDISNQRFNAIDETANPVIRLHQKDFPVMDFHVHLKGGFTPDWAFAKSRKLGINYGVAPNCGKDFELNEASKAHDFITYTGTFYPFVLCMQAEGREWYKLFGKDVRERFAYCFTDAMTFDDLKGKRTHIWRENEVDCPKGSEEAYMDLIVKTICYVLENEPADIYANPMRLPKVLENNAKKYWTSERRQKVLDALVKSGKALEINTLVKLPDIEFIKAAKARGVKFTFGSNNKDSDFGRFEYATEVIEKCALKQSDIYNFNKRLR